MWSFIVDFKKSQDIDFYWMDKNKQQQKSQNIFFYVLLIKGNHTGLERHEGK